MPPIEPLRVLSEDSLLQLRGVAERSPKELLTSGGKMLNYEDLKSKFQLVDSESEYLWDPGTSLAMPTGTSWEQNNDLVNAQKILAAFPGLTAADACDPRIWVTLAVRDFSDYTDERWPFELGKLKTSGNALIIHRFDTTSRARWRNQSISRLWRHAFFASRITDLEFDTAFKYLTVNSDFPAQLMGRTNTAASWKLAAALIKAVGARYSRTSYSRNEVRTVLKEIDLLLGRRNLTSLDQAQIDELVAELFNRSSAD